MSDPIVTVPLAAFAPLVAFGFPLNINIFVGLFNVNVSVSTL